MKFPSPVLVDTAPASGPLDVMLYSGIGGSHGAYIEYAMPMMML